MAVGLGLNFRESTVDEYDKVFKALNFPRDWPDGLIPTARTIRKGTLW